MNTYRINLTLEVDAVNPRMAKRLGQLVGRDIERSQRRASSIGAQGVTHAWIDCEPQPVSYGDWCEDACCPRSQCVACREELTAHPALDTDDRALDARREHDR